MSWFRLERMVPETHPCTGYFDADRQGNKITCIQKGFSQLAVTESLNQRKHDVALRGVQNRLRHHRVPRLPAAASGSRLGAPRGVQRCCWIQWEVTKVKIWSIFFFPDRWRDLLDLLKNMLLTCGVLLLRVYSPRYAVVSLACWRRPSQF